MTNYHEVDRPPVLAPAEVEKLLSMRLIANLATIDDDGGIHMVRSLQSCLRYVFGSIGLGPSLVCLQTITIIIIM
jgi:hypothetical protein